MKFRTFSSLLLFGALLITGTASLSEPASGASATDVAGLLYTVADLNSILAKTKLGASGPRYYDPYNSALRDLGPRLNITAVYDEVAPEDQPTPNERVVVWDAPTGKMQLR